MNLASTDVDNTTQFGNLGYLYGLMAELRGANAQLQTIDLFKEYKCGNPETTEFKSAAMFSGGEYCWELTFYIDIMTHDTNQQDGYGAKVFRLTAKPDGTRTGEILPYPYSRP